MQKTYYIKTNYLKTFARIESVCTLDKKRFVNEAVKFVFTFL